ncbi:MAG: 3-deoxy-manno-octulosonate cytidylyltransferase [Gammaproteobacteria bacterium]|nr:MAG: 3-deoxy-manno-octulosonate cytidylyltransferase [Gammaproteobacteria bacterium]
MHVIIPVRYASTRLPGKPLADICGKPLIQRVYECAQQSGTGAVTVATDDERIRKAAEAFGAPVCMTSTKHRSGTERIAEAVEQLGLADDEIVVNLQGDEPLMPPELIDQVANTLSLHTDAVMATACHPIVDKTELDDPNVVKVMCDESGYALDFSRAPISKPRQVDSQSPISIFWHVGIYAYRVGFVARYVTWPPCPLEQVEQLEQLRVLCHGERIIVYRLTPETPGVRALDVGVNTQADLDRVREIFREKENKK